MTPWHRFTQMVHLVALGLWMGTVVMSAAAAAVIFPKMKQLAPQLPDYAAYDGEHWLLAAGVIAERIFLIGDMIQFVCALLSIITLGALITVFRVPRTRLSMVVRVLALTIALAAFASQLIIVAQSMNRAVTLYRAAAKAGDNIAAAAHQNAFNDLHPIASNLMATTMVSVLVALAAGAWGAGRGEANALPSAGPTGPQSTPTLEEPRLLKGQR